MPPERDLPPAIQTAIRRCLSAAPGALPSAAARDCFSAPGFDWDAFLAAVRQNRLGPLVYYHTRGWDLFPPAVQETVRQAYMQTAWENTCRLEALAELVDHLRQAGIPVVLLKGAALLLAAYENTALRPMLDMDLLVREQDLERAKGLLLASGFYLRLPPRYPSPLQMEIPFFKDEPFPVMVELHTSLLAMPHFLSRAQLDWFWQNTAAAGREGVQALVFRPEAQVLHLCAHLWLHHEGGDLLNAVDVHRVIAGNPVDWDALLRTARAFDLLIPLQKVLPGLAAGWGTPIPGPVLDRLADLAPSRRERRKFPGSKWRSAVQMMYLGIRSAPDPLTAARCAWYTLFPYPRHMMARFRLSHPRQLPFFYLRRFWNLIARARF